jgi:hypothetical protein
MYEAQDAILQYTIPATRKLSLNHLAQLGLTEDDLNNLSLRRFDPCFERRFTKQGGMLRTRRRNPGTRVRGVKKHAVISADEYEEVGFRQAGFLYLGRV